MSHRDGRKVAVAGFVVSVTGTAGILPAPTPALEDEESSVFEGPGLSML